MSPRLEPGQLIIGASTFSRLRPGEVFIFAHNGKEKIKRIERISKGRVFFIGDNLRYSSDSRHFGWVPKRDVFAKVIWPRVHN